MPNRMTPMVDIIRFVNVMKSLPIRKNESHNAYYTRLMDGGIGTSRTTLQNVEKAMEGAESDDARHGGIGSTDDNKN